MRSPGEDFEPLEAARAGAASFRLRAARGGKHESILRRVRRRRLSEQKVSLSLCVRRIRINSHTGGHNGPEKSRATGLHDYHADCTGLINALSQINRWIDGTSKKQKFVSCGAMLVALSPLTHWTLRLAQRNPSPRKQGRHHEAGSTALVASCALRAFMPRRLFSPTEALIWPFVTDNERRVCWRDSNFCSLSKHE